MNVVVAWECMNNTTKTVTIPRMEYRELKKIRSRFEQVRWLLLTDAIGAEDSRRYKPAFVRKIKRSLREAAAGKGRIITPSSD